MTQDKVFQPVDYLDRAAAATPARFKRLVLERDTVMILLMWESYLRGKDCGKVTLADFFHPQGQPASYPLPTHVPDGYSLLLAPYGTKSVRGQRAAPSHYLLLDSQHTALCTVWCYIYITEVRSLAFTTYSAP